MELSTILLTVYSLVSFLKDLWDQLYNVVWVVTARLDIYSWEHSGFDYFRFIGEFQNERVRIVGRN